LSRAASGMRHLFEPLLRVHLLVRVAVWVPPPELRYTNKSISSLDSQ